MPGQPLQRNHTMPQPVVGGVRLAIWTGFAVILLASPVHGLGVNWGTQAAQFLNPSIIVQMLKDNHIDKVKLFDSDHWTVNFFAGTGIEVLPGIPNNQLERFADDLDNAKDWVKANISSHIHDGGVKIKHVAVGNEPFLKAYNGSFKDLVFPALKNIQKALDEAGLGNKIKATIPQNADVYASGTGGPSEGNFRSDIRDLMIKICRYLRDHRAPFMVNIYPFLSLYENKNFPVEFAFFDGRAKSVHDKGATYTNMFDANLDTLIWSLRKAKCGDVNVIVGEIGWPTDGNKNANMKMAEKFYKGFLRKMAKKEGTPVHKGVVEFYLFSLTDENAKSIAPGEFERHWGIFGYDGKPKFPIDFTGRGNDRMPVGAKNVPYLPAQWCVLDNEQKDSHAVGSNLGYACSMSDCSALVPGASCNDLDMPSRASYAFNMYFQINNQDVEACNFEGLAKIVKHNASTNGCLFPVALESAATRSGGITAVFAGIFFFCLALL
ncbi:PREDICTED: glucan endo-1,3-beta-glucosidase 8-like [Ipomoea nil]|uniref:glucan endo-1,3-beta-glucosidase 8-like n=1 Tax=Ipomoea nil TaxID=35883 RepID=UPI000900E883|nr:PREDICTED: glucan endo-1,3-beta-glucosidase 8-like [Ipomoea nil]